LPPPCSTRFPYTTLFRSEAVLSGVGAGVVGLDTKGRVTIINRSAEQLLEHSLADFIGVTLGEQVPEIAPLVERALAGEERVHGRSEEHTSELQSPDHLVC